MKKKSKKKMKPGGTLYVVFDAEGDPYCDFDVEGFGDGDDVYIYELKGRGVVDHQPAKVRDIERVK